LIGYCTKDQFTAWTMMDWTGKRYAAAHSTPGHPYRTSSTQRPISTLPPRMLRGHN